jgi:hypothetical protein
VSVYATSSTAALVMRDKPLKALLERRRSRTLIEEADRVTEETKRAAAEARQEAAERRARREQRLYDERLGR